MEQGLDFIPFENGRAPSNRRLYKIAKQDYQWQLELTMLTA
jgi:hypothetical protein